MFSPITRRSLAVHLVLLLACLVGGVAHALGVAPTAPASAVARQEIVRQELFLPAIANGQGPNLLDSLQSELLSTARGYLTTPQELHAIRSEAELGEEPFASTVRAFLRHPNLADPEGWVGDENLASRPRCSDGTQRDDAGRLLPRGPGFLIDGSRLAYAKLLAAHLTPDPERADAFARAARARLLQLLPTSDWGGSNFSAANQCILYLSWYVPPFVMAADLLESFPTIWSDEDKARFGGWLAREVFPKAAWASRARTNNWGSSGSYAAAMIADYLHDSELALEELAPARRKLTPAEAYREHTDEQLSRMSTTIAPRDRSSSRCLPLKGLQPSGGIPDELRRATIADPLSLCGATFLPRIDGPYQKAWIYQQTQVEALVAHAELAWRRGDRRLYTNRAPDGSGSLLQAIHFIIANPANPRASYPWASHRSALLFVAQRFYHDASIARTLAAEPGTLRAGETVTFGQLTHPLVSGEELRPPPVLPPPGGPADGSLEGLITSGGHWQREGNVLALSAPRRSPPGGPHGNLALTTTPVSGDLELSVRVRAVEAGSAWNDVAVIWGYQDAKNYAFLSLNERNDAHTSGVFVVTDGIAREVADIATPIEADRWYEVIVRKVGEQIEVRLDGALVASAQDAAFGDGQVGVGTLNDAAAFADITLTPRTPTITETFEAAPPPLLTLGGQWRVQDGALLLREPIAAPIGQGLGNLALHATPTGDHYALSIRVQAQAVGEPWSDVAIIFGYRDPRNYAYLSLNARNDANTSGVFVVVNDLAREVVDVPVPIRVGEWHGVELELRATRATVRLDGVLVATAQHPAFGAGLVGLGSRNDPAAFDDLRVLPLPQSLLPGG